MTCVPSRTYLRALSLIAVTVAVFIAVVDFSYADMFWTPEAAPSANPQAEELCSLLKNRPDACRSQDFLTALANVNASSEALCRSEYERNQCQSLAHNPDNKNKLIDCSPRGLCETYEDGWAECINGEVEFTKESAQKIIEAASMISGAVVGSISKVNQASPAELLHLAVESDKGFSENIGAMSAMGMKVARDFVTAIRQSAKESEACYRNEGNQKGQLIDRYNESLLPSLSKWKVSNEMRENMMSLTCTELHKRLKARFLLHEEDYLNKLRSGQISMPHVSNPANAEVLSLLSEFAKDVKQKALCYNAKTRGEIQCKAALFIGGVAAGGGTSLATRTAFQTLVSRGLISEGLRAKFVARTGSKLLDKVEEAPPVAPLSPGASTVAVRLANPKAVLGELENQGYDVSKLVVQPDGRISGGLTIRPESKNPVAIWLRNRNERHGIEIEVNDGRLNAARAHALADKSKVVISSETLQNLSKGKDVIAHELKHALNYTRCKTHRDCGPLISFKSEKQIGPYGAYANKYRSDEADAFFVGQRIQKGPLHEYGFAGSQIFASRQTQFLSQLLSEIRTGTQRVPPPLRSKLANGQDAVEEYAYSSFRVNVNHSTISNKVDYGIVNVDIPIPDEIMAQSPEAVRSFVIETLERRIKDMEARARSARSHSVKKPAQ